MTTDDLRTRAEEAAYEQCANDEQGDAFIEGYLAHAAQQPTREQIARTILWIDSNPEVAILAEREGTLPWRTALRQADAVLALFDGADR